MQWSFHLGCNGTTYVATSAFGITGFAFLYVLWHNGITRLSKTTFAARSRYTTGMDAFRPQFITCSSNQYTSELSSLGTGFGGRVCTRLIFNNIRDMYTTGFPKSGHFILAVTAKSETAPMERL